MKSISNKKSVIVGLFIFVGLAFFIVGILTIGSLRKSFGKTITVKTVFDDVAGLQVGNNVWFSGVKIGTVKKIQFYGNSQVQVTMNIDEKSQSYIRKDAKAKISTDGLIGNRIVVIYGGSLKSKSINNDDFLAIEKSINTDDIMKTLQENNQNLLDITKDFKTISHNIEQGKGTVGKLLQDESLYNNLAVTTSTLKRATENTQKLTESLSEYGSKINQKGSLANEIATDTVVFKSIKSTALQLREMAATANQITADLRDNQNSPLGVLMHDQQSAASLKTTLKNLETSSHKLDENLEAMQHNILLRRYFKKKAKAEADAVRSPSVETTLQK